MAKEKDQRSFAEKTEDTAKGLGRLLARQGAKKAVKKAGADLLLSKLKWKLLAGLAVFALLSILLTMLPLTILGVGEAVTESVQAEG